MNRPKCLSGVLRTVAALVATLLWFGAFGQEHASNTTLVELQTRLKTHLEQPRFEAALWGLKVMSLDTGKTLFEYNPQKLFSPASNSKLYTVALALDRLGADYRLKTSLYANSRPDDAGVLKSDLVVYGRGDPTITARLCEGDIFNALDALVAALTNAGVKRIAGDLIGDDSYFSGPPYGSGWVWDDMASAYGAEISALTINDNTVQVIVEPGPATGQPCKISLWPNTTYVTVSNRTHTVESSARRNLNFYRPLEQNILFVSGQMPLKDSHYTNDVPIHNPAGLFAALFKEAVNRHGIEVSGKVRSMGWLERQSSPFNRDQSVELGFAESLTMSRIAREVMKPSQNLYTDLLLAHVGERARGSDSPDEITSEELGLRELKRFVAQAGIRPQEVLFEEGSGLSRNNLCTPNATVALLQFMSRHPSRKVYLDSLPVAGVDGTLRSRMKGTPAAGNLRAKTGTLRWANSLSGQVTTAAGEHWLFSIMLNRFYNTQPNHSARADIDAVAVMLSEFAGRSADSL